MAGFDFSGFLPLEQYKRAEWDNESIYLHVSGEFYYAVISAYDYATVAHGKPVLLWRTQLTVDSGGVSMTDALPALLANAGPYLGKDTGRPGTFVRPVVRTGRVEVGTPTVTELQATPPAPREK
jgi:hypothetical protein